MSLDRVEADGQQLGEHEGAIGEASPLAGRSRRSAWQQNECCDGEHQQVNVAYGGERDERCPPGRSRQTSRARPSPGKRQGQQERQEREAERLGQQREIPGPDQRRERE